MRKLSEESEFDEDEDHEDEQEGGQKFGGFTSTVCVNFSQDDLRLATIPGQEGVSQGFKKPKLAKAASFGRMSPLMVSPFTSERSAG